DVCNDDPLAPFIDRIRSRQYGSPWTDPGNAVVQNRDFIARHYGDFAAHVANGPVDIDGSIRHVRCEIPVVPGDEVSVLNDGVSGISPRRTILTRTDPVNERRERVIVANV